MNPTTPRFLALLAAGTLVLASFASFPALRGTAILDDAYLPQAHSVDEVADLGRTFWLTSLDYKNQVVRGHTDIAGVTFRPTTEATLIATSLAGGGMLAHHVVSLLLHALTAFLVGLALARSGRPAWLVALIAGLVAAHPFTIEAWVWVAGRADLVAGLCVAVLAVAIPRDLEKSTRTGFVVGALALVVGTLAKETFVFVGPVVALRGALVAGVARPARLRLVALVVLPVIAALVLMHVRIRAETNVVPDSADFAIWLRRTPRLLGEATLTLAIPFHRVMRTLAYESYTPVTPVVLLGCAVFGLGLAASLSERRYAVALVLVGTAATLFVCAHVADFFWLGFDRFLYGPFVALAIVGGEWPESIPELGKSPARFLLPALVLGLAALAHLGARAYSSEDAFIAALRAERPLDPTGALLDSRRLAREGRQERALHAATSVAHTTSPALERERAVREVGADRKNDAYETIAAVQRARPNDAFAASDQITMLVARRLYGALPPHAEVASARVGARRASCIAIRRSARMAPATSSPDHRLWLDAQRILDCDALER